MIRELAKSIREYKKYAIATPLLVSMEVVMECIIPFLIAALVNEIKDGCELSVIFRYGGGLVVMAVLSLIFGALAGSTCVVASCGLAKNLRKDLFHSIQSFSFENIDKFLTSSLVTRLTTDVTNVQTAYMMIIRSAIRAPLMVIFAFFMACMMGGRMAWIFLFVIPLLVAGLALIIYKIQDLRVEDMDDDDSLYAIRDAIKKIKRTRKHAYDYDYILFDLPPHLGELSVAVLAAADHVLVPATVDSYSMNGYSELMDTVKSIRSMGLNPDLDIIGVFFTMIQPLQKYDRSMYQDVREQLGDVFIDTPIRSNSNAKLAAHIGCPLCWLKRSAGVTQDYIAVTEEVLRRCGALGGGEHLPGFGENDEAENLNRRLMN